MYVTGERKSVGIGCVYVCVSIGCVGDGQERRKERSESSCTQDTRT